MVARPKLRANSRMFIPMIPLAEMTPDMISEMLQGVPQYGPAEFTSLVENTIGAIHQVPNIFHEKTGVKYQFKHIEAYFGRSSSGSDHVATNLYQCWMRGFRDRRHTYGMVFAKTAIKSSLKYEKHGIYLIEALKEVDGLCISNKTLTAKGGVGSNEPGFLYLTFRLLGNEPDPAKELTYEEILECVRNSKEKLAKLAEDTKSPVREMQSAHKVGLERANDINHTGGFKVIDYSEK